MDNSRGTFHGGGGGGGDGDGHGSGGFHRHDVISAVQDEVQLYDDDDDYDDLYNDVNVGEGLFLPLQSNEPATEEEDGESLLQAVPSPPAAVSPPKKVRIPIKEEKIEFSFEERGEYHDSGVAGRYQDAAVKSEGGLVSGLSPPLPPLPPPAGLRIDLARPPVYPGVDLQEHSADNASNLRDGGFLKQGGNFRNESYQRQGNSFVNQGFPRQGGGCSGGGPHANDGGVGRSGGGGPHVNGGDVGVDNGGGPYVNGSGVTGVGAGNGGGGPYVNGSGIGVGNGGGIHVNGGGVGVGNEGGGPHFNGCSVGGGSGGGGLHVNGSGVGVGNGGGGPHVNGGGRSGGASGGTSLFVGDLQWWTTDAELEAELSKYGQVKEMSFFEEKASGKSKGYCNVEFYDARAAAACKDGMNGHVFGGKPCVVTFASPQAVRRLGDAQMNRNQQQAMGQTQQPQFMGQKGRGMGGAPMGGNFGRGGGGGCGGGGRGGGIGNRGQMGNMRNRMGPVSGRGMMGNGGMITPPMPGLHPGAMLGHGFDLAGFGMAMGRMGGGYGGFPPGNMQASFPGMVPPFTPVMAPHVNPAFFGRGMPLGGPGMCPDANMGGWSGEEQLSCGEDAASDQQYGEVSYGKERNYDKDRLGVPERIHDREKDVDHGREWPERRQHDDRDIAHDRVPERDYNREREREREREGRREREWERERERERNRESGRYREDRESGRYREERDRHGDHYRLRDRETVRDGDRDRVRSSRGRSKSREIEYAKRRRLTPV